MRTNLVGLPDALRLVFQLLLEPFEADVPVATVGLTLPALILQVQAELIRIVVADLRPDPVALILKQFLKRLRFSFAAGNEILGDLGDLFRGLLFQCTPEVCDIVLGDARYPLNYCIRHRPGFTNGIFQLLKCRVLATFTQGSKGL